MLVGRGSIAAIVLSIAGFVNLCADASAQEIISVTPPYISPGISFTIEGTGFGDKKPVVWLESVTTSKLRPAKVLAWSDTSLTCRILKADAGPQKVWVKKKGSQSPGLSLEPLVEVMVPLGADPLPGSSVDPDADAGMDYVVIGAFLGTAKGVVRFGDYKAKVKKSGWTDSSIVVRVPKNIPSGDYMVTVTNKVGTGRMTTVKVTGKADNPGGAPSKLQLSVPFTPQYTQVWCWAACSEMVLDYWNHATSQCYIVDYWSGAPPGWCCTYPETCLGAAPSMPFINQALYFGGLTSWLSPGPLPFATVKKEIGHGRPLILGYAGSFAGHVVVLFGYDANMLTVDIMDPVSGIYTNVPFAEAFTYGGGATTMTWVATIGGIKPWW